MSAAPDNAVRHPGGVTSGTRAGVPGGGVTDITAPM